MITEEELENYCLEWFKELGWNYAFGPDLTVGETDSQRIDYNDVVLIEELRRAINRISPQLPISVVDEVISAMQVQQPGLVQNNHAFHRKLLEGIPISYEKDGNNYDDRAFLVDFDNPTNNDFLVVNQFTVSGTKQLRRPDIVVFINGLPIAIIELKNPADEKADLWQAYNQLQTYKEELSDLFIYNQALVISDGITARIGSLTASKEWFMPWNAIQHEDDNPQLEYELEKIIRGFFNPELFLDYIRHFILFEQDGNELIKKIAGYHQFHGVREAVRVTLIASRANEGLSNEPRADYGKKVVPGSGKAGVFWHTQGSGKSISMCFYSGKLLQQPAMQNPTIVVVTDRNDLDGQLWEQFSKASDLLKQVPVQAGSRDELRDLLNSRQSGGIIFATIQKFSLIGDETTHPVLCNRSNVVVISDEAHRSHYGGTARLDKETGEYKYGYSKYLRDALPTASFIGFTGTPIALEDKNTRDVFGEYVSIYDIQDAVNDGATVPIYYESRLAKLDLNRKEIDRLNEEVDDVMEDEEDMTAREQTKSTWAQLAKLVGAEPRLEELAQDLVAHYESRTASLEGKAMIVCMSRDICVALFEQIIIFRPDWAGTRLQEDGTAGAYNPEDGAIRIVMTGSASDKQSLQHHVYSKRQKKRLEKRFKDPQDELKLVIVRDMWLTGFDAPSCHTMYVDKPMHGHNLMQAIARVNRVFKDKPSGLVVDYIGIVGDLKKALKVYTDSKGKGQPTHDLEKAFAILLAKLDVVRSLYHDFDYSAFDTEPLKVLLPAMNHISGNKDLKKRFLDAMTALNQALALSKTHDDLTDELKREIAFFSAVRAAMIKHTSVDRKVIEAERNSALKYILDNAVIAKGVLDVFELANIEKPDISLISDKFLDGIQHLKERNLAVELLERLLRDSIKARTHTNIVQEMKYTDRLEATLQRYYRRFITNVEVIEELIQMAKDMQEAIKRDDELGLNPDELAFYDALASNESALKQMENDVLKGLATELTEQLRRSTTIDWQKRESVRARLRILVRRLLRKYKYPPDGQKEAIELVLQQAETLSDSWTLS